jgi:hypothetical protein
MTTISRLTRTRNETSSASGKNVARKLAQALRAEVERQQVPPRVQELIRNNSKLLE